MDIKYATSAPAASTSRPTRPATRTAADVMSTDVVTVPSDMPVATLARLMGDRHLSGVPVIDAATGALVGVVTESDILRRLFAESKAERGVFSRWFGDHDRQAERYTKAYGRIASDVMTPMPLVTADEEHTLAELAEMLVDNRIRRVPVLCDGRIVGIVSRADLLSVLLDERRDVCADTDDRAIENALNARIKREPFATGFYGLAKVEDGVVTWEGFVPSEPVHRAVILLTEAIEGVKRIDDRLLPMPYTPRGYYYPPMV